MTARGGTGPGASTAQELQLSVSSVPVTHGRREQSRVSQIPALGSLKLPICGIWESPGAVGTGQERFGKLSVPLLFTVCSCYQQCLLWSPEGLGLGAAAHAEFSLSIKDSSEVLGTDPTQGWGFLRAVSSRTLSWAKWPQSVGFHTRDQ